MGNSLIEGLNYITGHPFRNESERMVRAFDTDTYKEDGVIRWKSNGRVPPQEVLDFWKFIGKRFNMSKSAAARKREQEAFLKGYRKTKRKPSQEELFEMQAAFGKGTVVDVITGKKTKL